MHWPRIRGLCSVSWCLAEGQWNGDQRRHIWAVRLGKDFTLFLECILGEWRSNERAWVAVVAGLQIGRDVSRTPAVPPESRVEDAEPTAGRPGTQGVHQLQLILVAAEEPVVATDAPSQTHPPVQR